MALESEDLEAIKGIIEQAVRPLKKEIFEIKKDLVSVKEDVTLLAIIGQLEEIKKDKLLRNLL
jgi:hypothetical protein